MRGGFPTSLLVDPLFTDRKRRATAHLLLALVELADEDGIIMMSWPEFMAAAKRHERRAVHRHFHKLAEGGYLEVADDGLRIRIILLCTSPDWKPLVPSTHAETSEVH